MQEYHICHICGEKMYPTVEQSKYHFKGISIIIDNVHIFRCENCGEGVLESEEAKRVENILFAEVSKKEKQ